MKIKTSEATGLQLDWGLANATGKRVRYYLKYNALAFDCEDNLYLFSHTDPAVCMWLIEQYKMDVTWGTSGKAFVQMSGSDDGEWHSGKNLAEAVARCVISMKLGDEFECPSEFGGWDE